MSRTSEDSGEGRRIFDSLHLEFWVVCLLHLLFSNAHRVFGHFDSEFLKLKFGYSKSEAGMAASLTESVGESLS